eukprot:scaffold175546_cov21-Tisochrysis_lutea.AAC.1
MHAHKLKYFAVKVRGKALTTLRSLETLDLHLTSHMSMCASNDPQVHAYHHNRTGYAVLPHVKNFSQMLMRSKFCLATQVYHRVIDVMSFSLHLYCKALTRAAACDHVYQPFEPELDWNDFSVRVLEEQIPILHEILAAVDEETYRRKQGLWVGSWDAWI